MEKTGKRAGMRVEGGWRGVMAPAVLVCGVLASLASNVPGWEEEWHSTDRISGPVLVLEPGQSARFTLRAEGHAGKGVLLTQVYAIPAGLDAPEAGDTGADSGADTGADTGADSGSTSNGAQVPVSIVTLAYESGDYREAQVALNGAALELRDFGAMSGCEGAALEAPCRKELAVELSVAGEQAVELHWGARYMEAGTWQRCDEEGEPAGCEEEEPEVVVGLEILPG